MIKDLKQYKLFDDNRYHLNKKKTTLILATSIFAGILTGCANKDNTHLKPADLNSDDTFIAKIYDKDGNFGNDNYHFSILGFANDGIDSFSYDNREISYHKHYYDFITKKYYTDDDDCIIENQQIEHKRTISEYRGFVEYLVDNNFEKLLENNFTEKDLIDICDEISKKEQSDSINSKQKTIVCSKTFNKKIK